MKKPKISCIYVTVREDYSITCNPQLHQFVPMLKSFQRQTFKNFEIVLVDGLYEERKGYEFPRDLKIKHVPHHPNHRLWLDKGYWSVCEAFNTGIIHSDGELLIFLTDCIVFGKNLLQQYWDWYQKGYFPLCGFKGIGPKKVKTVQGQTSWSWDMDGRLKWLKDNNMDVMINCPADWWFGLSSAPISAVLAVNGYDELFDGSKGLEDMDMGARLSMVFPNRLVLDSRMVVINLPANMITRVKDGNFKHNYPLLVLNRKKKRAVANRDKLTEEDIKYIYERTLYEGKLMNPNGPNPMNPDDPMFQFWLDHQPIFSLEDERNERIKQEHR